MNTHTCEICKEGECKTCGACGCTTSHWMVVKRITSGILIIAGINWALYGLLDFDIIEYIFGFGPIANIAYSIIGLCAIYKLVLHIIKYTKKAEAPTLPPTTTIYN